MEKYKYKPQSEKNVPEMRVEAVIPMTEHRKNQIDIIRKVLKNIQYSVTYHDQYRGEKTRMNNQVSFNYLIPIVETYIKRLLSYDESQKDLFDQGVNALKDSLNEFAHPGKGGHKYKLTKGFLRRLELSFEKGPNFAKSYAGEQLELF